MKPDARLRSAARSNRSPAPGECLRQIGIRLPIVQGPMNGASPPCLVAGVSNAGGLGSLAAALFSAEQLVQKVEEVRALTRAPFNVNLFVLRKGAIPEEKIADSLRRLTPIHLKLGLAPPQRPAFFSEDFDEQFEALLETPPPVASFTFGLLQASEMARLKKTGVYVIGTATTVAEALAWQQAGADAVCAQGYEAGGHRASFLGDFEQSAIGTMALLPQISQAVAIPCIAAGGIMDGRAIGCALTLGASAAQVGTAFLTCPESGIGEFWREALAKSRDDSTRLTRSFSGRWARGIVNEYMETMRDHESDQPDYPYQNALTMPLRRAAALAGNEQFSSLWAGQGAPLGRPMSVASLMELLEAELHEAFDKSVP